MNGNLKTFLVVGGIFVVLTGLYINAGHLKNEQAETVARYSDGSDEQSRLIRNEVDQYRLVNQRTQHIILAVGIVIVGVVAVWWVLGRASQAAERTHTED